MEWRFFLSADYYFLLLNDELCGSFHFIFLQYEFLYKLNWFYYSFLRSISLSRQYRCCNDKSKRLSPWYSSFIFTRLQKKWTNSFGDLYENLQTWRHCRYQSEFIFLLTFKVSSVFTSIFFRVMVLSKRVCHIDFIMEKQDAFST